jgi:putative protein-disulfide isomerase
MLTLHYIFDPLCGWCYGAAPLIDAAAGSAGVKVVLHGGGMLAGANRRSITAQWRDYVMPHDQRIASLSGQAFGTGYYDGLLRDIGAPLDSAPPTTAILAAEELGGQGLAMAHRVQRAHYVDGWRIAEPAVLQRLAIELGLDAGAFAAAYARLAGEATLRHFAESRDLLARVGGQGFPTVVLEALDGRFVRIDIGVWLGRAQEFAGMLRQELRESEGHASPHCGADGCRIR